MNGRKLSLSKCYDLLSKDNEVTLKTWKLSLKLVKFHQNYFPNPKGSNFDEIFKAFFHPLGLGERKTF